jgi:hypothetical protein
MRIPEEIRQPALFLPRITANIVIIGKLALWLFLTLIIGYFIFYSITSQLYAIFSGPTPFISIRFMPWFVLGACLGALGLARQSIWQAMQADENDIRSAVRSFVRRFLGLDLILASLLILLAYPLPPSQEFLIFRIFVAVLAGFLLVFGRRAALVASIVIAIYGASVLVVSVLSSFLA